MRFYSSHKCLRLVVKPTEIRFEKGVQLIDRGKTISFVNGEYVTDDPSDIEWLRNCSDYGREFYEDKIQDSNSVANKLNSLTKDKKNIEKQNELSASIAVLKAELENFKSKNPTVSVEVVEKKESEKPNEVWMCQVCNFKASSKSGLTIHQKRKHPGVNILK